MKSHYDVPRSMPRVLAAYCPPTPRRALAGAEGEQSGSAMGGVVKLALAAGLVYLSFKMLGQELRETRRS